MNVLRFAKKVKYCGVRYLAGEDIEVKAEDLDEMIGHGGLVVRLSSHVKEEHEEKQDESLEEKQEEAVEEKPNRPGRRSSK